MVSCDRLNDPDTLMDSGNSFSSSSAASALQGALASRTFTDITGFPHACSEYVSILIPGSWESDSDSWLLTFNGTYEPGTRIFRFQEGKSTFGQVAGPPLHDACGVA